MKVQRYTKGRSNVSELQAQRSSLRTPAEVAKETMAPYAAISQISDTVADAMVVEDQRRKKIQDEEDAMTSALNVSNYKNTIASVKKQAIDENWKPELYEQNMEAVNKAFMGSAEMISERNRSNVMRSYQSTMASVQLETALVSSEIKRTQLANEYNVQRGEALRNKEYETVMFLDDMAHQSGYITEAELNERNALMDSAIASDELMAGYVQAVESGTEADYLANVPEGNYTDETKADFIQRKNQYDNLLKQQNAERELLEGKARDKQYQDYWWNMTPDQTDAEIRAFSEGMELSLAQSQKLLARRNSLQEGRGAVMQPVPDRSSAKYKKQIDEIAIKATGTNNPEVIVDWEIENANAEFVDAFGNKQRVASLGQSAVNAFEYATSNEDSFMEFLPKYERLMQIAPNVNHGFNSKTDGMFKTALFMSKGDPEAAKKVFAAFGNATEDEYRIAKQSFNEETFWAGMQEAGAEAGLVWEDEGFAWYDLEAPVDPIAKAKMLKAGQMYYAYQVIGTGYEDYNAVRNNTAEYTSQLMGMTSINAGVPVNDVTMYNTKTDEVETRSYLDVQVMANPVCRSKEECKASRAIHTQDMVGKKVLYEGETYTIVDPVDFGPPREIKAGMGYAYMPPDVKNQLDQKQIPANHIEIFSAPVDRYNEHGQVVWGQRFMGKPLYSPVTEKVYDWTPEMSPDQQRELGTEETGLTDVSGNP